MKFPLALVFLLNVFLLSAETSDLSFSLDIKFGFCSSAGSGQAIALVSDGTAPYTYQWSDASLFGNEVFDLNPGAYSLTVVDATGCEEIGSFEIPETSSVWVQFEVEKERCFGTEGGRLVINDYMPEDLQFGLDGVNFSDETIFENLPTGSHTLYILESNGCITTQSFTVESPAPLIVDLGPDYEIRLGDSVRIEALINSISPLLTVQWTSSTLPINCTNCLEVWVKPLATTTVNITVENENECIATDEIIIYVNDTRGIFIPNVFTPNEDGVNDIFKIFAGINVEKILKFTIANNVGGIVFSEELFSPDNSDIGWDGTFRGVPLNPGVFIYQVRVEYIDGTIEDIFGSVTLIY